MSEVSRRLPLLIPLALALTAGFLLGSTRNQLDARNPPAPSPDHALLLDAFWQAWDHIQMDFVDPDGAMADPDALIDSAIRGMVLALDDENSAYLDAQHYPLLQEDWSGAVNGIGAIVQRDETTGSLVIAWVLPATPAAAAGLQSGDIFAEVDGRDVLAATHLELAVLVRGPVGTQVQLTMLRAGQPLRFDIIRARIAIPNVESRLLADSGFGYVRLRHFSDGVRADLDAALAALNAPALPALVLDLRGNPGGMLASALDVAGAFLDGGQLLIEDFGSHQHPHNVKSNPEALSLPLALLVDERSASASELIAGAFQHHGRATIVGASTFGKGTMQNLFELPNGGGLQLTVARWLTPGGDWIHGAGITPDLPVPASEDPAVDAQLQAAIAHLQSLLADRAA